MRYIRTEDKIMAFTHFPYDTDNIEELCDEFVIKWNSGEYIVYHELEWAKEKLSSVDDNEYIIYGAIWTDKGLIYVAKMNDKGELELL